jgi:hypothetical protein
MALDPHTYTTLSQEHLACSLQHTHPGRAYLALDYHGPDFCGHWTALTQWRYVLE